MVLLFVLVFVSDVNKAISIKAKAKDYQFVSRPGQGQGQAKGKAEFLQEQDKPPPV